MTQPKATVTEELRVALNHLNSAAVEALGPTLQPDIEAAHAAIDRALSLIQTSRCAAQTALDEL